MKDQLNISKHYVVVLQEYSRQATPDDRLKSWFSDFGRDLFMLINCTILDHRSNYSIRDYFSIHDE